MPLFDLPLDELKTFQVPDTTPADFDAFWEKTFEENAIYPLDAQYERVNESIYQLVDVYDLTFTGYGGQAIKGWFIEPAGNTEPLPCIIRYLGYGGGRSMPIDHLAIPCAGFAHLVMDTRGQGASWSPGATGDIAPTGGH